MHPRYALAIFDFDGTLLDSFDWFAGIMGEVAHRYGFRTIAPDQHDEYRGLNAREIVRRLGVPAWKMPLIANHIRKLAARDRERLALFPGTDAMLRTLHARGVTLAVVSSNAEQNVRDRFGPELAALIDVYETGAALFGKPRKLRHAVRRSGRAPTEALVIGDELRDLEAARVAGLAFGAVAWGYTRPDALRAAGAKVFETMDDIVRCFDRSPDRA